MWASWRCSPSGFAAVAVRMRAQEVLLIQHARRRGADWQRGQ